MPPKKWIDHEKEIYLICPMCPMCVQECNTYPQTTQQTSRPHRNVGTLYSHALLPDSMTYIQTYKQTYSIVPCIERYGCAIDIRALLAFNGHLVGRPTSLLPRKQAIAGSDWRQWKLSTPTARPPATTSKHHKETKVSIRIVNRAGK